MFLQKIINRITNRDIKFDVKHQNLINADILSQVQISELLDRDVYIPSTEYSLRPYTIAHILNDILINNRKHVVEFGSGASSIFICNLIQKNRTNCMLSSIDHDKEWQSSLQNQMRHPTENVEFINAPLTPTNNGVLKVQHWYDEERLREMITQKGKADLVIIDGPPGDINDYARYPAVNFVAHNLTNDGLVIVDDTDRDFEQRIVKDLVKDHGFIENPSFRHVALSKIAGFNTNPIGRRLR